MCYERRDSEQAKACFERDQRGKRMAEYIEREALVHHFMTTRQYLTKDLVMDAAYEISKFPAANVQTVVHGRWVGTNKGSITLWSCSECQTLGSPQWKGCPVCLARMDGAE